MNCVIKSFSTYEESSAFQSYMSLHDSIYGIGPNAIASTVERKTDQTPMHSAHAQQAVAVLLGADGCLAVILFQMRSDMLMRQIK